MRQIIGLAAGALTLVADVFGYGHEGHQAIAEIARSHLSPEARAAVVQLLGTDDLPSVATWLDDVRAAGRNRGNLKTDQEAKDFIQRFPNSSSWHFVNLPVGAVRYDGHSIFATENDVVHAIGLAVNTLEGSASGLSKVEALKVLVHCVGDLHQPLHCVSGYYDLSNPSAPRLLAPEEATTDSVSDAGGNALFFTQGQNLHELFDSLLLPRIVPGSDFRKLAVAVERQNEVKHQASPGDYHLWPEIWASESVRIGTAAYQGLTFGPATTTPGRGRTVRLHRIEITLPATYEATEAAVLSGRISEAGLRLAELLNSIRWAQ